MDSLDSHVIFIWKQINFMMYMWLLLFNISYNALRDANSEVVQSIVIR